MCGGSVWEHAGLDVLGRILQARVRGGRPDLRLLIREANEDIASRSDGDELELVCECEDGRCLAAVGVSRDDFLALAGMPGHYVVLPGHEAPDEEAVFAGARFAVVTAAPAIDTVVALADVQAHGRRGRGRSRQ
jgi:hypothetical protein